MVRYRSFCIWITVGRYAYVSLGVRVSDTYCGCSCVLRQVLGLSYYADRHFNMLEDFCNLKLWIFGSKFNFVCLQVDLPLASQSASHIAYRQHKTDAYPFRGRKSSLGKFRPLICRRRLLTPHTQGPMIGEGSAPPFHFCI